MADWSFWKPGPVVVSGCAGPHGEIQQFGTDFQARAGGGFVVDLKPYFCPFLDKIDHAAVFGKTVRFAHGQNAGAFEALQDGREARFFRTADENDMAICG